MRHDCRAVARAAHGDVKEDNFNGCCRCLILMIAGTVYLLAHWGALPERVPIRYGWAGKANGWIGKEHAWIQPCIMWGIFILSSVGRMISASLQRRMASHHARFCLFALRKPPEAIRP